VSRYCVLSFSRCPLSPLSISQTLKEELEDKFGALNGALTSFYNEMNTQGHWNDVSLVLISDFGRTLTANSGDGSDHVCMGR
jgi:uncharacterized protein (DUF1501 family)